MDPETPDQSRGTWLIRIAAQGFALALLYTLFTNMVGGPGHPAVQTCINVCASVLAIGILVSNALILFRRFTRQ